ncbi:MAG: DUF2946 domain-containing protein [Phenylobacterium sp.]|nr:MAG: DUF2946 domain-containing protein [Phenylobacterium sp.]
MGAEQRTGAGWMRGRRLGLALVLLMAVVVRALAPAGWMPNTAGLGGSFLVICTGTGSEVIRLGKADGPAKPHSTDRHGPCAFAGLVSAPPSSAVALAEPRELLRTARLEPTSEAAPTARLRHREQAARAPPELA